MHASWQTDSLPELEGLIWAQLGRSVAEVRHAWSLPALGTCDAGGADVRTVVLREADRAGRRLVAYADARSEKIRQLRADARTAWHFYDSKERVQLRARGLSFIEWQTDVSSRAWELVPEANRANYRTMGSPGLTVGTPAEGHIFAPGGVENFALIVTTVSQLDWVWLAPAGHRRAHFDWADSEWLGRWTIP